jgi:hypothetical protein
MAGKSKSKKAPPKRKAQARKAPPMAPPAFGGKKKTKMPTLGGGLMGLGGTGASGMMP